MSTDHKKKEVYKNIEIWPSYGQFSVTISARAHIWAYAFWPVTHSFFIQSGKKIYRLAQETETFHMSTNLHGLKLKLQMLSGDAHI